MPRTISRRSGRAPRTNPNASVEPVNLTDPPRQLPYRTPDLPGSGGRIKVEPEDFQVEEIPAYLPSGEGDHLYLWLEKRDTSHEFLLRHLSRTLDVDARDIGTAGIKDRFAVTRQWVSVPSSAADRLERCQSDDVTILEAKPHGNKLKTGHLKGNRFRIVIRDPVADGLERARGVAEFLSQHGFANYYGVQRFGRAGSTLRSGWRIVSGAARPRYRGARLRLELSAVQSHLFNESLRRRIEDQLLDDVLVGDVMQVVESGGLFVVEDAAAELLRTQAGETSVTGPLFGPKMKQPVGVPAERETSVLQESGLSEHDFCRFKKLTRGGRRALLVRPHELSVAPHASGLEVSLTLPPGCYATVVLWEMMKHPEELSLPHFETGTLGAAE